MNASHKNKTFATLLAILLGSLGGHRFYLYGWQDTWAWVRFATLPLSLGSVLMAPGVPWIFAASPLLLSVIVSVIETLVIGLTPDEKWDARHNPRSGKPSRSGWPVIILLVLSFVSGTTFFFFLLARTVDLIYTGGSFG